MPVGPAMWVIVADRRVSSQEGYVSSEAEGADETPPARRIPAMSMTSPNRIEMSLVQQQRLGHLIRAGATAQQLVARARIVLLAAGWTTTKIALRVGVCVDTVRKWRHRWWASRVRRWPRWLGV